MAATERLRVNRVHWPVTSLGPGRRAGVWVQGCGRGCPGCISPGLWPEEGGRAVEVEALAALVTGLPDIDGLTVSGGEPIEQLDALVALCRAVKRRRELDILVYTGERLEELQARWPSGGLLEVIDGLVDGPFLQAEQDGAGWRGSRNQRYFRIRSGSPVLVPRGFQAGPWSVAVEQDGTLFMTGIPGPGDLPRLYARLRDAGITVRET